MNKVNKSHHLHICININIYSLFDIFTFVTDSVPPETVLLIVNALYFKAAWSVVFEEVDQKQPFTKTDGKRIFIPMVRRTSRLDSL